jgi:hypothetical protein
VLLSSQMRTADNFDSFRPDDVPDGVWEATKEDATGLAVLWCIQLGSPLDCSQARFDRPQELRAEAGVLGLVPLVRPRCPPPRRGGRSADGSRVSKQTLLHLSPGKT